MNHYPNQRKPVTERDERAYRRDVKAYDKALVRAIVMQGRIEARIKKFHGEAVHGKFLDKVLFPDSCVQMPESFPVTLANPIEEK